MLMTPGRSLLLSRARASTHPTPSAFPLEIAPPHRAPDGRLEVHPSALVVAGSAVVMAVATVANVVRHWHTGR